MIAENPNQRNVAQSNMQYFEASAPNEIGGHSNTMIPKNQKRGGASASSLGQKRQ